MGAHAVMANGGVLAPVGIHMVALAARRHAVPFVVLAGVHKVCQASSSKLCMHWHRRTFTCIRLWSCLL